MNTTKYPQNNCVKPIMMLKTQLTYKQLNLLERMNRIHCETRIN